MKFNKKQKRIIFTVIATLMIGGYYFLTHYPIGTFTYSTQNSKDLNIHIRISEELGTFQEPVYNMSITIKKDELVYIKNYETSDNLIFFMVLRRNEREFIVFNDFWKGYCKCENGNCGDFFNPELISFSIEHANNDTTYFQNYGDAIKGDTLTYIQFKDFQFKKLK